MDVMDFFIRGVHIAYVILGIVTVLGIVAIGAAILFYGAEWFYIMQFIWRKEWKSRQRQKKIRRNENLLMDPDEKDDYDLERGLGCGPDASQASPGPTED